MAQQPPYTASLGESINITHSSPSVPRTSSFWLHSDHTSATRYGNRSRTNEHDHCFMKSRSNISADTRIWLKTAGGGYTKSPTEMSNGFDKNTVIAVDTDLPLTISCETSSANPLTISSWSDAIASASHGDMFSIYTVGKDWPVNQSAGHAGTSSRFVFVNGVLTKRNYEFDIYQGSQSCKDQKFPTLDMPSDQIQLNRSTIHKEPVRAIMFIEPTQGGQAGRSFIQREITWCDDNNYGHYYLTDGLGANIQHGSKWIDGGSMSLNKDKTHMLATAISYYSPWYEANKIESGSIQLTSSLGQYGCRSGMIDNLGRSFLVNKKAVGNITSSCLCCDLSGSDGRYYEINQIELPSARGFGVKSRSKYATADTTHTEHSAYYWDWQHYEQIWHGGRTTGGAYISKNEEWNIIRNEVNYGSIDVRESEYESACGCSANTDRKPHPGSNKLTVSNTYDFPNANTVIDDKWQTADRSGHTALTNAKELDSYMLTAEKNLQTKSPDCECNEILGWSNTSANSCLETGSANETVVYDLIFSDGYRFTAGAFARLITHNPEQRNNASSSISSAENAKWPYNIKIPSVQEIYNNRATYVTESNDVAFIKCADLYPGNTKTAGHVFLISIQPEDIGNNQNLNNQSIPSRFLDALDDTEFKIERNGTEYGFHDHLVAPSAVDGDGTFQKHGHMTTFATTFPRSIHTASIFSGCVMVENGLYVMFEDFCFNESSSGLPTSGCTDPTATSYDWSASIDDGSCYYQFSNNHVFNKINVGGYQTVPATFSASPRGNDKVYNYNVNFDVHKTGVGTNGLVNSDVGDERFVTPNISLFTTDGFESPIYAHSFQHETRSLCGTSRQPSHLSSSFAVDHVVNQTTAYVESASLWIESSGSFNANNIVFSNPTTGNIDAYTCAQIDDKTGIQSHDQAVVKLSAAYTSGAGTVSLASVLGLRPAGIITFSNGITIRYKSISGTTLYVQTSSVDQGGHIADGTGVASSVGFFEMRILNDGFGIPYAVTRSSHVNGYTSSIATLNQIALSAATNLYSGFTNESFPTSYSVNSEYYYNIVLNKDKSNFHTNYSSSLYSTLNYSASTTGNPNILYQSSSSYPFTSAPTMSEFDWSYSNTSVSNVSITSGSGYAGSSKIYKNALSNVKYLDLTNPPSVNINTFADIAACPNLEYLKINIPAINPTVLDITVTPKLKHLVVDGAGDLQTLNALGNKELESIEIVGNCLRSSSNAGTGFTYNDGGSFHHLYLDMNCKLKSLKLIDCLETASNVHGHDASTGLMLSHASQLEDLTIVGGNVTEFDISKNSQLKNIALYNMSMNSIDTSCAGSNLQTLFLARTNIDRLNLSKNTNLQALSVANSRVSASIYLAEHANLKSLSYRGCKLFGKVLMSSGSTHPSLSAASASLQMGLSNSLIDLDVSNTNVNQLNVSKCLQLETLINDGNFLNFNGTQLPIENSGSLINVSQQQLPNTLHNMFEGNDSIQTLNVWGNNFNWNSAGGFAEGYPYFPKKLISIIANDSNFNYSQSITFSTCSNLQHVEIERCNLKTLRLITDNSQIEPPTSSVKHLLANKNQLSAYPTASVIIGSDTIINVENTHTASTNADGVFVIKDNLNADLKGCESLQIFDFSGQTHSSQSVTYLDLRYNDQLRVLRATENQHLVAIRFGNHSILKLELTGSVGIESGSLTIDVSNSDNFTHFIVDNAAASQSLMHLNSLGYINPVYNGTNWSVVVA